MASGELNSIVDGLFCLVSKLFYFALGFAAAVDSPFPTDYWLCSNRIHKKVPWNLMKWRICINYKAAHQRRFIKHQNGNNTRKAWHSLCSQYLWCRRLNVILFVENSYQSWWPIFLILSDVLTLQFLLEEVIPRKPLRLSTFDNSK